MDIDKAKERIAKLKRHAESARELGNEQEAEAFAAEFQRLASKYKLSLEEVELDSSDAAGSEDIGRELFDPAEYNGPSAKERVWWQEQIAGAVARAFDCKFMVRTGSNLFTLVGYESDRKCAGYVICTLIREAERLARNAYQRAYRRDENTNNFYTEYYRGFIRGLRSKLEEQKRQTEQRAEDEGNLVKLERARERVAEWFENNANARKASRTGSSRAGNRSARQKGKQAGRNADVSANGIESKSDSSGPSKLPS